jgi:hypothetical protein
MAGKIGGFFSVMNMCHGCSKIAKRVTKEIPKKQLEHIGMNIINQSTHTLPEGKKMFLQSMQAKSVTYKESNPAKYVKYCTNMSRTFIQLTLQNIGIECKLKKKDILNKSAEIIEIFKESKALGHINEKLETLFKNKNSAAK